jgi:nitrile hydratase subunit beta
MNGPQDMGGFIGFGPVQPEDNEPVFHSDWERRAFGTGMAMGMTGSWNIDQGRHVRERLDPVQYWSSSYYEYRQYALEKLLVELALITPQELQTGRMSVPPRPVKRVAKPEMVPAMVASGGGAIRQCDKAQKFQAGDKVRAHNINPLGHTRLVRYARGKTGEIIHVHGTHVLPDSSAHGKGDDPQWLYTVRFTAKELWGKDARDTVCIDMWEPYLESASFDAVRSGG